MSYLKHGSHWCHFLESNSILYRCSPPLRSHLAWAHHAKGFRTQSKLYANPDGGSQVDTSNVQSQLVGRQRLSAFWAPTGGIEATADDAGDSHSLLVRAGFIRQAHAGVFQFLPLGLRIQEKLERLLDKHMTRLGASKVSLSTLSSQDLWRKSGRMSKEASSSPGIFQVQDRREGRYILSPTHEEEITSLVGSIVNSYKDLPLKLYQITRKYRDEARPRQGLLRTREFVMKDLYTFDASLGSALESYHTTREAYGKFFDEFKLPYLVAKAASGDMGGDLSHEFHFLTSKGEDNIVSCATCDYVANEELAEVGGPKGVENIVFGPGSKPLDQSDLLDFASRLCTTEDPKDTYRQWYGYSADGKTIVQVIYPSTKTLLAAGIRLTEEPRINPSAVQQEYPDLDLSTEHPKGDPMKTMRVYRIYDATIMPPCAMCGGIMRPSRGELSNQLCSSEVPCFQRNFGLHNTPIKLKELFVDSADRHLPIYQVPPRFGKRRSLLKIVDGDQCANCKDGRLRVRKAVELGHTFHLGTRYTQPLNATVAVDPARTARRDQSRRDHFESDKDSPGQFHMQMGCHGIGVSRLIAAAADALADSKGLNWPRVMAPFEAVVVPAKTIDVGAQAKVYDVLARSEGKHEIPVDAILDDRPREFGWKLKDADMIGYPVIVVIGRGWPDEKCEVQCRRLKVKEEVPLQSLKDFVTGLLNKL